MFPDRLALVTKLGSVEAASGARSVVEHLIELHKEQDQDNVLWRKVIAAPSAAGPGSPAAPAGGSPGEPRV